jgi:hypothetical protein
MGTCAAVSKAVYGYTCEFQSWEFHTPIKGLFSGFFLRHLVLSPQMFSTSTSDFLENICARSIFSKSSEFFVGQWEPLNFVHLSYFSRWFFFSTAPAHQRDAQKTRSRNSSVNDVVACLHLPRHDQ